MNRRATVGELSASLAHEINQPLGAILTNAETAELIANSPSPDMAEIKEIMADIKRDDQRASRDNPASTEYLEEGSVRDKGF